MLSSAVNIEVKSKYFTKLFVSHNPEMAGDQSRPWVHVSSKVVVEVTCLQAIHWRNYEKFMHHKMTIYVNITFVQVCTSELV